ncbi:J domain-containing protein [Nodosilinea sp. FACHB-13]|uniref:J domain-containing protein n=1 Tax=Cyanophyceae TaxID=3028117 RepID=UPI001688D352|nr:J domain-containing protein [Nodosilinea sp. FACHB-13]MBD2105759.1 DnaJ domain-containing protein [Nodosilinea sp. FACHB-13]
MKPDQGLFQLDFDDHHAVLGVPVTADAKAVRKRYLAIARMLHPDSLSGAAATDAQRASDILSKLVNPAYEALTQEKSSTEHGIMLKLKAQSLRQIGTAPTVSSAEAQSLLKAPHADAAYRKAVGSLAESQFDDLENVTGVIGELSELNLIYLYRSSANDGPSVGSPASAAKSRPNAAPSAPTTTVPTARQNQAAILESYVNRAQEYDQNRDYSRAILELREAVKAYPNNVQCHSYLSAIYLKAGQSTMARIHAKRALEIDPNDERAQSVQARVDKTSGGSTSGSTQTAKSKGSNTKASNSKSSNQGGGFFGLFGGKKK